MSRPKAEIPLVTKLADAFKAVGKLKRNGRNARYPFTRATDVFEAVRQELFSRGVLVLPNEGIPEYVAIGPTNGGDQLTECRLPVSYIFRDHKEELPPLTVNGIGRDIEDKSLYKAQTGAEKALLKRVGLMAEEVDDPEWDGNTAGETLEDIAPMRIPKKEKPLANYQVDAVREGLLATGKTDEQLSQIVVSQFHAPELTQVRQKHFPALLRWATDGKGTLTAPKPQAVPAAQPSLPLRTASNDNPLKIGNKSIEMPSRKDAFSI